MTTRDLTEYKGKKAQYNPVNNLVFTVKIVDSKFAYGHTRFLIEPVSGTGQKWVDSNAVNLGKE